MASTDALSSTRLIDTARTLPPDLRGLAVQIAGRLRPGVRGGTVYTDDRAPVEWLTDLSILRYATGAR
jgi:hypothetical protein